MFEKLRLVANTSGEKSEEKKRRILINLMRRCRSNPVDITTSKVTFNFGESLWSFNYNDALQLFTCVSKNLSHVGSEEEITKDMLKRCDDEVKYVMLITRITRK